MSTNLFAHSYLNPLYNSWKDMRKRCSNPNRRDYKWYGGKGISVCPEWESSFLNFANDMAATWFVGATLGRQEHDKNYYKENCRWETISQQQLTRSNVKGYWECTEQVLALHRLGKSRKEIMAIVGISYDGVGRIIRGEGPGA